MQQRQTTVPAKVVAFLNLRGRKRLVEGQDEPQGLRTVWLSCVSDDAQGDQLEVVLDAEIAPEVVSYEDWSRIGRGAPDTLMAVAIMRARSKQRGLLSMKEKLKLPPLS